MLAEIFYWLFNMSIAASVTGCVLLLLRRIRWIPRRVTAALWAIPFLRTWIREEGYEQAFFLEAVKTNLQIHQAYYSSVYDRLRKSYSGKVTDPGYGPYILRQYLKDAPRQTEKILKGGATEENLAKLCEIGLPAAPYVADRIRQGETEWTPYFETQLLGLTAEERFEELVYESKNNISDAAELYARRREVAKPVDAARWIEDNAETLAILREITG